ATTIAVNAGGVVARDLTAVEERYETRGGAVPGVDNAAAGSNGNIAADVAGIEREGSADVEHAAAAGGGVAGDGAPRHRHRGAAVHEPPAVGPGPTGDAQTRETHGASRIDDHDGVAARPLQDGVSPPVAISSADDGHVAINGDVFDVGARAD